jgi:hypothetical protein
MNRKYKLREGVDWYDESMGIPMHNQCHSITKKYYNEYKDEWCSKKVKEKLKVSKIKLIDFNVYPISKIKEDFGLKYWERVAMFLTRLYRKHYAGYKIDDWKHVYWSYDELVAYLTKQYIDYLEKLIELGVININLQQSSRDATKDCKYIRLNDRFRSKEGYIFNEAHLVKESFQNSLLKYYEDLIEKRNGIFKSIENTLDKCNLNIDEEYDDLINSMVTDKEKKDTRTLANPYASAEDVGKVKKRGNDPLKRQEEYKRLLNGYYQNLHYILNCCEEERRALYNIDRDKFGYRLNHVLSNMPRAFRKHLKLDGVNVVEVDINASQPSFLMVLLHRWFIMEDRPEMIEDLPPLYFMELTKLFQGQKKIDVYKYMNYKLNGLIAYKDKEARNDMKSLFYCIAYGNPIHGKKNKNKKELIGKIFSGDFYHFLLRLTKTDLKVKIKDRTKNMSALLQREESAFLDKVIIKLIADKIDFLPLYDSLIVKSKDEEKVRELFYDVIMEENLIRFISLKNT